MVNSLPFINTLHADAIKIKQDYATILSELERIALPEPAGDRVNQHFYTCFLQYSTDAASLLRTSLQQLDKIVVFLRGDSFNCVPPANGEEEAYRSLLQTTLESAYKEFPLTKRLAAIATDMSSHINEMNPTEHPAEGKEAMYLQYAQILSEHRPELESAIKISTQRLAMLEMSHDLYQEQRSPPADQPEQGKPLNVAQLYAELDELVGNVEKLKGHAVRLDSTLKERESELQDAKQSIDELTINLTYHQQQLAKAQEHIILIEKEYEQQRATNKVLLEDNAALNDDNADYLNRIQDLSAHVENYQFQLAQREEKGKKLEADVARERTINFSLLTQTKGSIAYKDQEIRNRDEKIRSQKEELRDLKEKLVRFKEDLSDKLGEI